MKNVQKCVQIFVTCITLNKRLDGIKTCLRFADWRRSKDRWSASFFRKSREMFFLILAMYKKIGRVVVHITGG